MNGNHFPYVCLLASFARYIQCLKLDVASFAVGVNIVQTLSMRSMSEYKGRSHMPCCALPQEPEEHIIRILGPEINIAAEIPALIHHRHHSPPSCYSPPSLSSSTRPPRPPDSAAYPARSFPGRPGSWLAPPPSACRSPALQVASSQRRSRCQCPRALFRSMQADRERRGMG